MAPGGQTRPPSWQPTHLPAVQVFYAWIKDEAGVHVATGQDNDLDDFIPTGKVEAYLRKKPSSLPGILADLFGSESSHWHGRTSEILTRYSVVFAILVSIGHGGQILNFLRSDDLCDDRLPFDGRPTQFPWASPDSDDLFNLFKAAQLRFCAVKFKLNSMHEFNGSRPLPFLKKELLDEGGSAKVYKVQIHASHDLLHGPGAKSTSTTEHKIYALKAYESRDGKRYHDVETNAFKKLGHTGLESSHVVGYYCSYKHGERYYALLEYADKDTLEHFIQHQQRPILKAEIVAFWNSVLHVMEAIVKIHDLDPDDGDDSEPFRFTAVHQDIKPKNILTKSKPNVSVYEYAFGLADLGTSSLIAAQSKRPSRDNFGGKTYGPPECFRGGNWDLTRNIKITPSVDVWSFACVLSELCVWVTCGFHGNHGVEGYRSRRAMHNKTTPGAAECFHHKGRLSTAVLEEHTKILQEVRCDPTTEEILRILPFMLEIKPEERWSAKTACDQFKHILQRSEAALTAERPTSRTKKSSRPNTASSGGSHPLSPRLNHRLSESTEGDQRGVFDGVMPTFAAKLSRTPPQMTIDSHDDQVNIPSLHAALEATQVSAQGASQPRNAEQARASPPSRAPPDLTRSAPREGQTSSPIPAIDRGNEPESTEPNRDDHVQTASPKTPPVHLSFRDAHKWRKDMKAGGSVSGLSNLHILEFLEGRDHVFMVDDSQSMHKIRIANRQAQQYEVDDYVDVLSYMVKRQDPDGIDLYYFNSLEKIKESKNSTKLHVSVKGHKFAGSSSPEKRLVSTLDDYGKKLRKYLADESEYKTRSQKSRLPLIGRKAPKLPHPLSVYVLTDGAWELGGEDQLKKSIRKLIGDLHAAGCGREQIGIQFIRFGDHPEGVERLKALDQLGRSPELKLDIVDTEPVRNGNVWKMLLGAIDEQFDADWGASE